MNKYLHILNLNLVATNNIQYHPINDNTISIYDNLQDENKLKKKTEKYKNIWGINNNIFIN